MLECWNYPTWVFNEIRKRGQSESFVLQRRFGEALFRRARAGPGPRGEGGWVGAGGALHGSSGPALGRQGGFAYSCRIREVLQLHYLVREVLRIVFNNGGYIYMWCHSDSWDRKRLRPGRPRASGDRLPLHHVCVDIAPGCAPRLQWGTICSRSPQGALEDPLTRPWLD
jgi:hypothetical protein